MSNHLGNVLEVITDRRFQIQETATGFTHTVKYYEPDVLSSQDYNPFGMITFGRSWEIGSGYRFGFNGKESDKETYGKGNVYDYGFRIYNPRLGKFLSVDPLTKSYPELTSYQFASNTPIWAIDMDGLEAFRIDEKHGYLQVTLIDITVDFQVFDNRTGANLTFWPEDDMQRQLGGTIVSEDKSILTTPDGQKFYNPNGQGPQMDKTPQNFLFIFKESPATRVTLKTIPGGYWIRHTIESSEGIVEEMVFGITGLMAVDMAILDDLEDETWKLNISDYDVLEITVAPDKRDAIVKQLEEWEFDPTKVQWKDPEPDGPDFEAYFKIQVTEVSTEGTDGAPPIIDSSLKD
jgi:RHS repeat-associated protein